MLWILIWLELIHLTLGAKHYLFKTCHQSGFCHRNLHYADHIGSAKYYHVDTVDIDSQVALINGNIIKKIPSGDVILNYSLGIINDGNIRFTLNEHRVVPGLVNSERYNSASEFNINYIGRDKVHIQDNEITFNNTMIKIYKDFKIEVMVDNDVKLVVNADNLMNFEHHRTINDQQQLNDPESDFNMFEDSFKDSINDQLPLGPESIAMDFKFNNFQHLYGAPEHSDGLELGDKLYRLFNVDIFEYEINSTLPMYGSIPFIMAMDENHPTSSVGLFWINAADTYLNVKHQAKDASTHWISENGVMDFIIFLGDNRKIHKNYGDITGFTLLPPMFSLGYHQCRWNYNDESDVKDISTKFDEFEIPYDTIWLDIEYAESKKYFTWSSNFPTPEKLLSFLDHTGRNLVVIVDPHIKTGYEVSDHLIENKLTIMNNKNSTYYGHCWPGESVWVDAFNPKAAAYWDYLHSKQGGFLTNASNIHLWNDMNEISVFNGPETSSPRDNLHYGDWEDRSVHNLNGLKFHNLTYNSLLKRQVDTNRQRPFILTRSFFAGSQKTAAMWTGDNMSKWEYLKISIPMVINNGMSGMPFAGADVGGFFGDPSKELLTRWYQTGIFYPFFRAHAHIDSRRREPWVPGEPFTSYIRDAIRLRYKLLPIFYTSFYHAHTQGLPILKPIFYDTGKFFNVQDQFYIGDSGLLVKPVTDENANSQQIIIPDDEVYYNYTNGVVTNHKFQGPTTITVPVTLNDIPILARGGHIIFTQPRYRRSTRLMRNDPYTMTIFLSKSSGTATGELYVDDGESFNYETNQEYLLATVEANKHGVKFTINNSWGKTVINQIIVVGDDITTYNVKIPLHHDVEFTFDRATEMIHDEL